MPNRNVETGLEETEKVALTAEQRGEHSRLVPQGLFPLPCPSLEGVGRGVRVFEDRACGHFPDWWVVR